MIYKVMFWIMVASTVAKMIECTKEHPRQETPKTLGFDMVVFVVNLVVVIFLGMEIWGHK